MKKLLCTSLTALLALPLAVVDPSAGAGATLLIDEGHGQRLLVEHRGEFDLSRLAAVFSEAELTSRVGRDPLADETLAGVDALVVSGAFSAFSDSEVQATKRFLERGGRLCIMLHIAPPLSGLLASLGVSSSNGVIREQADLLDENALTFRVTRLSKHHPLTLGLASFDVRGAWALLGRAPDGMVLAETRPGAWVDLNHNEIRDPHDVTQTFAVAVGGNIGKGAFVVFSDDAVFQNRFLNGENERLAKNLARWLRAAAREGADRAQGL